MYVKSLWYASTLRQQIIKSTKAAECDSTIGDRRGFKRQGAGGPATIPSYRHLRWGECGAQHAVVLQVADHEIVDGAREVHDIPAREPMQRSTITSQSSA